MMREKIAVALLGLMTFGAVGVNAAVIPLSDTGAGLADGAGDPNYSLVVNPDATGAVPIVQDSTAFPIVGGPWVGDIPTSKWIGPRFNTAGSAAGFYDYLTTFNLPLNANLATATISGSWAFDDGGGVGGIVLNGVAVAPVNPGFGALTAFVIPAGAFVIGANTLDFTGTNGGSYTGLLVRGLTGSYSVPEPASLSLLGLGGLSLLGRRRRA